MAGITGMGTTYELPNFTGDIVNLTPAGTPFLSAIGGLSGGGRQTDAVDFEWQTYDLRPGDVDRQRVEGADAPDADNRVRTNHSNITEIHQEKVEVSYTKMAATGQRSGLNINGTNPVSDELAWQTQQALLAKNRDIEVSFLVGEYHKPADNTERRKTRGLFSAIETNVVTAGTLSKDAIDELMTMVFENGGLLNSDTATLMVPPWLKREVSRIYASAFAGYSETSRTVGGVNMTTIVTDFGQLNVMVNRNMAQVANDTVVVVSLDECFPVFLEVPGKGHFFLEPLAKTGASESYQLYGEVGLRYGDERQHGKIVGIGGGDADGGETG